MSLLSLREFSGELNKMLPLMIRRFIKRQVNELSKGKITLAQFVLLDFLNTRNESKMSELAQFMEVTTAAMTGIIDRLERYNYVLRKPDPEDRRIIRIKLTPHGARLLEKIYAQRQQMIIDIFGKVSERERQDYLNVLRHIHDILSKEEFQPG